MKTIIISPHTDDAIFSIGSMISKMPDVTIASPFAAVPNDELGHKKHTTLRAEHRKACKVVNAKIINGPFLDDVYPASYSDQELVDWLEKTILGYDKVYIPLGIHHPDHLKITNIFWNKTRFTHIYKDLPYAVRYSDYTERKIWEMNKLGFKTSTKDSDDLKLKAVMEYRSQIDQKVIDDVMVEERIWWQ